MQMNDICSLELCELCDICACVGNIHLKEILPTETVGNEDAQAFPSKLERLCPIVSNRKHCEMVSLFIAHKHLHLDTILLQGFHQSVGGNGSTTDPLRCVDN